MNIIFYFLVSIFFKYMMGGSKGKAEGEYLDISYKSSISISTVLLQFLLCQSSNLCKANIFTVLKFSLDSSS